MLSELVVVVVVARARAPSRARSQSTRALKMLSLLVSLPSLTTAPATNTALVFIKPHAATDAWEGYIKQHLSQTPRMEKYLNTHGRQIIGWDEILEGGLAPQATVMSWRGEKGGIEAAKMHHDVIMTPWDTNYLDHYQAEEETEPLAIGGFTTVEDLYNYEPVPAELSPEEAKYILGAQGNVWTEYMHSGEKVEYMVYPRAIALSEVLWTPAEQKNWDQFFQRLQIIFHRLDIQGVNYAPHYKE